MHRVEEVLDQWEGLRHSPKGMSLYRRKPYDLWFLARLWDFSFFDSFLLDIEKLMADTSSGVREILDVGTKLYNFLRPAYGEISTQEMHRKVRMGKGEILPGIDPEQGLPDIYWANFLGPEYVEMIGQGKTFSAPCHRVERLADGGALLILTESPLDFDKDPQEFDRRRTLVRTHLGEEAFYSGDKRPASRLPNFRFSNDRRSMIRLSREKMPKVKAAPSALTDAKTQLEQILTLSEMFTRSARAFGKSLDYSVRSLDSVEDYLRQKTGTKKAMAEFESLLGAYVGVVLQKHFGGTWRLDNNLGTPALDIPKRGYPMPLQIEPFEGSEWPFVGPVLEEAPDIFIGDRLVRVWPFAKAIKILRSDLKGNTLLSYVDASAKALEMKGKTLVRIV